jgi:hypothetical protein
MRGMAARVGMGCFAMGDGSVEVELLGGGARDGRLVVPYYLVYLGAVRVGYGNIIIR